MKISKHLQIGLLSATLICAITVSASALSGFTSVAVTMDSSKTSQVLLGQDSIHKDEAVSTMIDSSTIAAVNGGFFNSYYTGGTTFPDDCPQVYGAIVKDGMLINGGDTNNMIGFDYNGNVYIDRVDITPVVVRNNEFSFEGWGVNKLYTDSSSVAIMTDVLDYNYTVPSGFTVVTVTNNVVTSITSPATAYVADNSFHVVYGPDAVAHNEKWGYYPAVGDKLELTATYSALGGGDWSGTKTAVTGGRMLVINGVNVTADTSYNSEYDTGEAKQNNTDSYGRSYAAVMNDGSILFGTATATFPELANHLISLGAKSAVSMDGGASSMAYGASQGYVCSAGRKLASILAIQTSTGTETQPTAPAVEIPTNVPVTGSNVPSSWAVEPINTATSLGLIPSWMTYGYTAPITRDEFCQVLATFIPAVSGKSLDTIRGSLGANYDDFTFTDTDSYQVRSIAALGIVNGTGDGKFSPNDTLLREEAATMLQRMVDLLGTTTQKASPTFADQGSISDWAVANVAKITGATIMNGDGTNFNPQDTYTKEEAFITMLNTYNNLIVG
ncbi:MAG: phosphodiester glycosidase family protein [Eubacteriales bacterium]